MSVADHPLPTRLATRVGGNGRLLATVMGLPLVDGLFPALVLSGVLDTWAGLLQVGLLVFGGSAAVVVVLAEFPHPLEVHLPQVLLIGIGLCIVTGLETLLAPTMASVLDLALFKRFTAIVIITIAAKTASAKIGEWLPRPSITIALGVVASFQPTGAELVIASDPMVILRAVLAVVVAIGLVVSILVARPFVTKNIDMDRFRFGSSLALCLVAGSILTPIPEFASLAVFSVSVVLAYAPESGKSCCL